MLELVTITGSYNGNDERGIIVGGKQFLPNNVLEADVQEEVFLNLIDAENNGWFKVLKHNYEEFVISRGRNYNNSIPKVTVIEDALDKAETPVVEIPAVEIAEEKPVVIEEQPVSTVSELPEGVSEFNAMTVRSQNEAIRNGNIDQSVLEYVSANPDEYKESTVKLVNEILAK